MQSKKIKYLIAKKDGYMLDPQGVVTEELFCMQGNKYCVSWQNEHANVVTFNSDCMEDHAFDIHNLDEYFYIIHDDETPRATFIQEHKDVYNEYICSVCHRKFVYESIRECASEMWIELNFCPLCGVKLEGIVD